MLSNSNVAQTLLRGNPMVQRLMQEHPELASTLQDPELMRQALRAAMDPSYRAELTRAQDQAMRHVSALPGGEAAMQRMYTDVTAPLEEDMATAPAPAPATQQGAAPPSNPWARRANAASPAAGAWPDSTVTTCSTGLHTSSPFFLRRQQRKQRSC